MSTTIRINGKTIVSNASGNVSIVNGKIKVDGVNYTPDDKNIYITITGDLGRLEVDACEKVSVAGNVSALKTMSGDVEITGDVTGDVKTMSGDVKANDIGGRVSTMSGDIKYKKPTQ